MTLPANTPNPQRLPGGFTSDPPYGPLAASGMGNPFFYHQFEDDFDNSLGATGIWTVTLDGGTAAHTAGDGGLALLTTAATSSDYVSMQLPAADFVLPQGTLAGKKFFFLTRLQLSDVTNSALIVGVIDTITTPFSAITDGVYFYKASGGTVLQLKTVISSTASTWTIPASAYSLAANTNIDLAFSIDRLGGLSIFVGSQLVGWIPQSGTGTEAYGYSQLPVLGRCAYVVGPNQTPTSAQQGPWSITTANLNPTIAVQTSAAAAKTLTADFIGVQKER